MGFKFIHTADWQIGRPFRSFPKNVAGRLEEARLSVIDRIADVAHTHGAAFVLVAGDVYDATHLPSKVRRQPLERMRRHADITWVLMPGNHDAASRDGIWERVADGPPDNVVLALEPAPIELGEGVWCLPAPLVSRSSSHDLSAYMDDVATPSSAIRIGLAHGSIRGFGSRDESSNDIDPARGQKARLDYLALGDWHGMTRINARTWYSGTPEVDRYRDNKPGHVLVVEVEGAGADPVVTPISVSQFEWLQVSHSIASKLQMDDLERQIAAACDDPARVLVRLQLEGTISGDALSQLAAWKEVWEARLQHLDIDESGLVTHVDPDEIEEIAASRELSSAVSRLDEIASGDGAGARVASRALQFLVAQVNAVVGEGEGEGGA